MIPICFEKYLTNAMSYNKTIRGNTAIPIPPKTKIGIPNKFVGTMIIINIKNNIDFNIESLVPNIE